MGDYFLLKPAPLAVVAVIICLVLFLAAFKIVLGLIGFSAIGPVAGKPH